LTESICLCEKIKVSCAGKKIENHHVNKINEKYTQAAERIIQRLLALTIKCNTAYMKRVSPIQKYMFQWFENLRKKNVSKVRTRFLSLSHPS